MAGTGSTFRPRLASEDANASMSLATNLAIAQVLLDARTGLFRVMPEPDERAVDQLRHAARALELPWPASMSLQDFEGTLDPARSRDAAFMLAIRRAGGGASYQPYEDGVVPWHAAMAATYAHATAPLRRLADRHVCLAALALANGRAVPDDVSEAFVRLPKVMGRADSIGGRIAHASIDLAESVVMMGREGQTFAAVVTDIDDRGARVQLAAQAVVARVAADGVRPGDEIRLRLVATDPVARTTEFEPRRLTRRHGDRRSVRPGTGLRTGPGDPHQALLHDGDREPSVDGEDRPAGEAAAGTARERGLVVQQPVVGAERAVEPHRVIEAGHLQARACPTTCRTGARWCRGASCRSRT